MAWHAVLTHVYHYKLHTQSTTVFAVIMQVFIQCPEGLKHMMVYQMNHHLWQAHNFDGCVIIV